MRALRLWRHHPDTATDVIQPRAEPVPDVIRPCAAIEAATDSKPAPVDETGILPPRLPPVPRLHATDANRQNALPAVIPIRFITDDLDDSPRLSAEWHAAALIGWLQDAGHGGTWAAGDDLAYAYSRLCEARGWDAHPWNMVCKFILRANGRRKRHPRASIGETRVRVYFIPPRPAE